MFLSISLSVFLRLSLSVSGSFIECFLVSVFVWGGRGPLPRPVLVLCPPSLMSNWQQELRRWGPFAVEVLSGGTGEMRQRVLQRVDAGLTDVLVASRGLPRSEEDGAGDVICSRRWGCVVVDEVHQAKNPKGHALRVKSATLLPLGGKFLSSDCVAANSLVF